jgi:polyhydroxybutyrate depolymerase
MYKYYAFLFLFIHSQIGFSQTVSKTDSIEINGIFRKFIFNEPPDFSKNKSLIFVLHGSGGNGNQMLARVPAIAKASVSEHFIAVFPFGYKGFWNECRKSSPAESNKIDIDEQAFFQSMINYFVEKYQVDRKQVFVIGTSG